MSPKARSKFYTPMFEPEVFQKQCKCTVLKKVQRHCWDFSASPAENRLSHSDSAPGFVPFLLPLSYATVDNNTVSKPRQADQIVHSVFCQKFIKSCQITDDIYSNK